MADLFTLFKREKRSIDKEIARVLPRSISRSWIEEWSGKALFTHDPQALTHALSKPVWNFLDRGGKRWRPVLLLATAQACGGRRAHAMKLTPIPELIHNGCVAGDTLIWKADGTVAPIKEIREGESVLSLNKKGEVVYKKVVRFHDNGIKEVLRITTNNRSLTATPNHPFLTVRKEQPTRAKITSEGREKIRQRLAKQKLTISKFCKEVASERNDLPCSMGHMRNALYGYEHYLLPQELAAEVVERLNINPNGTMQLQKCTYEKANVLFEWKKAEELKEGDLLVISRDVYETDELPLLPYAKQNTKDRFVVPEFFTVEMAQLAGFLVGDGHIDKGRVTFCLPENDECRTPYEKLIEKAFKAKPTRDKHHVVCCSNALATIFREMGLGKPSLQQDIPGWVFLLPKEHKRAFLRGYLDSDGTVAKNGRISFECGSEHLIAQLKFLVDSMGFVSGNLRERKIDNSHFGSRAKKKESTLYGFDIYGRGKVLREIGTENSIYQSRLGNPAQRQVNLRHGEKVPSLPEIFDLKKLGFSRVSKVEKAGKMQTYDLQIEDTHNYIANGIVTHNTIITDDVEDLAETRRGEPALHMVYGEDIAINAGNTLYFLPLRILERARFLKPKTRQALYQRYVDEMVRLSLGQAMDIYWHRGGGNPSEKQYLQMCLYKTGVLARLAAQMGAIVAGAKEKKVEALGGFGAALGVGFQIQDDILNIAPQSRDWGKSVGEDITEGKRSLPVLYALRHVSKRKARELEGILNSHTRNQGKIKRAISIIKESGAIEYAQRKAQRLVKDSWREVAPTLKKGAGKEKLRAFAGFAVNRTL